MNKLGLYSNTARSVNHLRNLASNNPTNNAPTSPENSSSVDGVELSLEAEQLLEGCTPRPPVLGIPSPNSGPRPPVLGIPSPNSGPRPPVVDSASVQPSPTSPTATY